MAQRRRERRDGNSLLPMRLFVDRGFSAGLVTQSLFQGSMNAFTLVFLIYVQSVLGFDAFGAGLTLLAFSVGAIVGMGAAIPLANRAGRASVTVGLVIQAGGVFWAMTIVAARGLELSGWHLVLPLAMMGVGLALVVVPLVDIALSRIPVADAGAASGAYGTFQQLGAALGVAIGGTVFFTAVGDDWSQPHVLAALWAAAWVAIGGYLIAGAASLVLPRKVEHRAETSELESEVVEPVRR